MKKSVVLASASSLALLIPHVAAAQEQATEGEHAQVEDIVVTARKRAENIQDVPISITAYSGDQLDRMNVNNVIDLSGLAPGVQVHGGDSSVAPKIYIRGVGSNDYNPNNPSPTAVYIDGVLRGSSIMQLDSFFDLERAEILRGPQGTLFGRNATAGALNLTSRRPGFDFSADGTIRYGQRSRVEIDGGMSVPLTTDTLAVRVAGSYIGSDGYTLNRLTGRNVNDLDRWALRAALLFKPASNVEIVAHVGGGRANNGALQGQMRGLLPTTPQAAGPDGLCAPAFYGTASCTDALGYADDDGDPYAGDYSLVGKDRVKLFNADLTTTVDFGNISLVSVSGLVDVRHHDDENTDSGPNNLLKGFYRVNERQLSQEFRLQSNNKSGVTWVAGLFYLHDRIRSDGTFEIGLDLLPFFPTPAAAAAAGIGSQHYPYRQTTASYAMFGEVSVPITEKLSATGGLRWSRDDKAIRYRSEFVEAGIELVDFAGKKGFSSVSGRAVLNYDWTDNVRTYASYSRGFKSGGFFGGLANAAADLAPYDDETLNSYELGLKSELFDRRVRFNLAGFYYDYKDLQVYSYVQRGATSVAVLDNASDATIKGVEAEVTIVPATGLTLSLGGSLLDTEYKNYISFGQNFSGNRLPTAPKTTFNASMNYERPIGGLGDFLFTVDTSYRSKFFFNSANIERLSQKAYWLTNGEVGLRLKNGFEFGAWARNLFGKTYYRGIVNLEALGFDRVSMGEPRSVGGYLRFRY